MPNTVDRAKFWKEFIISKCQFPALDKLCSQFDHADFSEFCDCGCNSFKVNVRKEANVEPLTAPGKYAAIFEADFQLLEDGKTLEIILFTGADGHLAYVEIDCCANSCPVPETIEVREPPYNVHASKSLAL